MNPLTKNFQNTQCDQKKNQELENRVINGMTFIPSAQELLRKLPEMLYHHDKKYKKQVKYLVLEKCT